MLLENYSRTVALGLKKYLKAAYGAFSLAALLVSELLVIEDPDR